MKVLVTGAAGFIGYHVARRLLHDGCEVIGLDNMNTYYDVRIKQARLAQLQDHTDFSFVNIDISDSVAMAELFRTGNIQRVVHLAAQAGVRHSLSHPMDYVQANLVGHVNILEGCRHHAVEHLAYASSSSVYGLNRQMPLAVDASVDHPVSLYAATKKSNELMSHSYAHLFALPVTGLRFFTVYGPWGRPDMALFLFTKAMLEGRPIDVFNHGDMRRDFTYIDDIVEGIVRVLAQAPKANPDFRVETGSPGTSSAPYRVFNIGRGQPIGLMDFIHALENALGIKAQKNLLPMQPGDVPQTWAEIDDLFHAVGYTPKWDVADGVQQFVNWYHKVLPGIVAK